MVDRPPKSQAAPLFWPGLVILVVVVGLLFGGALMVKDAADRDALKHAEQRYWVAVNSKDQQQACEEAGKLKEAYLEKLDTEQYERWSTTTAIHCRAAERLL